MCITHISVSATPPSGRPYKGLSFSKVRSEPCTQVLSRHFVWKNKNGLLARPCPVSVCGGHDSQRPVSRMSFPFSPPPPLFLLAPLWLGNQDTQHVKIGSQAGSHGLPFGVPSYWKSLEVNLIPPSLTGIITLISTIAGSSANSSSISVDV